MIHIKQYIRHTLTLAVLFCLPCFCVAQFVSPWLTTGSKTALLQLQPSVSFSQGQNAASATISIDPAVRFQTMDGFGFCLTEGSAEVLSGMTAAQQDALLNELFNPTSGIGISVLRISIGASDLSSADYTYNDTAGDVSMANFSLAGLDKIYLLPILKKILTINPDIKILATPWTAPRWMKSTLSWIGGTLNTNYYGAYASYFVKYFDAMKSEGINIWAITPQNEPLYQGNDPSMGMSSAEQLNFINNYLGLAMANAGYSGVKIIAYDHNCDNTAYPIEVCNNSKYVDGAAFHLYGGNISALTTVKNATNKNVYFTEQYTASTGGFSGDLGWHLQNVVLGSANNWAKAVIEWNLANNSNIGPHTSGGCSTCLGAITVNSSTAFTRNVSYYIVGQISKFVKPGAVRIASSVSNSSVTASAFLNPDGSVVLLAYNGNSSSQTLKVSEGTQSFGYDLPAVSVVTFVWNEASSSAHQIREDDIAIYPNPAKESIRIKSSNKFNFVSLYNTTGNLLMENVLNGGIQTEIDVSHLSKGVYILNFRGDLSKQGRKFVKL